jgi:hypothetical protein
MVNAKVSPDGAISVVLLVVHLLLLLRSLPSDWNLSNWSFLL